MRLIFLGARSLSERFKLIEEDGYKVDVFVEVDEEAAGIWRRYLEIKSQREPLVRRNEFLKIKKVLSEHIISVSRKFAASLLDENLEMGYISRDELPYYYDPDTGFRTKGAGEGSMIF